jgi:uncharacterized protein YggU (UPF0235/DUF167 family)
MSYVHVLVTSGSNKETIREKSEDHFIVSVKEKAEHNMANNRVLEIIALHFKIPKNKVRIINGHRHPSKLLMIED